ncbi:MAG: TspO/MBR family protein [Hyphomicrobiaceae bacterium]
MSDWHSLIPFVVTVVVVAASGAIFMPGPWYRALSKPSWTPPDWAFGPAWTVLYLMIAVAGWLVWTEQGAGPAIAFWAANIVFNGAWSWLMFGLKRIRWALADAIAMLLTIIGFIATAWPVSQTAALLFVPYLAWVTFATALNWAILARNPQAV